MGSQPSLGLSEVLQVTGGRFVNSDVIGDRALKIAVTGASALGTAREGTIAFFFSKDFQAELLTAQPSVLITGEPFVQPIQASGLPLWNKTAIIACADPYYAMAKLSRRLAKLHDSSVLGRPVAGPAVVHPSAVIDPTVKLADGVRIGPNCVVEAGAEIGEGTELFPSVYIGPGARLGKFCVIFPNVTIYEWTEIGNRVRIHSGSVVGADGFGYAPKLEAGVPVSHEKIYHLGRVVIEDEVELGANVLIDRATFGETRIGKQAKLDNAVHIGHNSRIGEGVIMCGMSATAGGTTIEKFVYVGGKVGIGNKAVVGPYAKIGAMSIVDKDIPAGGSAVGNPQRTHRDHFKAHAILNRLVAENDRKKEKKEK